MTYPIRQRLMNTCLFQGVSEAIFSLIVSQRLMNTFRRKNMKISNTYTTIDGTITYVEFEHSGRTQLLSRDHFEFRFGNAHISEFERAKRHEKSPDARLSDNSKKTREAA